MSSARSIQEAESVDVGACDFCATAHINLFDKDGNLFASAGLPAELIEPFIARLRAVAAELAARCSAPTRRQ
jgi:hypothetical protein